MELIREVGAFAGLAAFIGLAVLALLYFAQARDVRRLRENAEFLVEGPDGDVTRAPTPAPTAVGVGTEEPEEAARAAAATAPSDAEAFRRAELARQAAERRQRFEQRRRGARGGPGEGLLRRMPAPPSLAVIAVGALLLVAGVVFGGSRLLGEEDETSGGPKKAQACPPGQTQVAVLNGTAQAGLAQNFAAQLKQKGYQVRPVTNTEEPFDTSVVMFDQGGQPCVAAVASTVGVGSQAAISASVQGVAEGARVVVVLGEDKAAGGAAGGATGEATGI